VDEVLGDLNDPHLRWVLDSASNGYFHVVRR